MSNRPIDVIIFGATGYTGRLVAEYFYATHGVDGPVKWALAGRNLGKLEAIRDSWANAAALPLVMADAEQPASLRDMAAATRVMISTAGPFSLYGSDLVAACAELGTDYVDLCGEIPWIAQMIDRHQATAHASGARLVFSCGFDSVPFDLGVWFTQQLALQQFGQYAPRVRARMRNMQGVLSGGTFASVGAVEAAAATDPALAEVLSNPFAYTPGFKGVEQPDGQTPHVDELTGSWVGPFIMSTINTKAVHRTNYLQGHPWGEGFQYDEMLMLPAAPSSDDAPSLAGFSYNEGGHPQPGQGPTQAEIDAGFYDVVFYAELGEGRVVMASVSCDEDPGYLSTSKMLSESALALAFDVNREQTPGGCWTPAAALNSALIARLSANAGVRFVPGV
ncbi:saccharopine dehydrogenase [Pseudomonas sp. M47T1]|uniref:saccharopine dehydrogenase family protein n=1 Tax=Pseudomonas sp. M47T1 TaxID=1179778 RepID=UPI00026075F1|nr:saccharopine dehydrogenase NADP-binding domain-containing protein [Pseudomonas sp. M47T1]EIK94828.1 saccharopine dehydrogenase [Pseudomonas sp. M47T1]